jgi:hypothetical protein
VTIAEDDSPEALLTNEDGLSVRSRDMHELRVKFKEEDDINILFCK